MRHDQGLRSQMAAADGDGQTGFKNDAAMYTHEAEREGHPRRGMHGFFFHRRGAKFKSEAVVVKSPPAAGEEAQYPEANRRLF